MGLAKTFALAAALSVGGLWVFGRSYPIVVEGGEGPSAAACALCDATGVTPCPECGGSGSALAARPCPTCGGSGQGEWRLRRKADRPMSKHPPLCLTCSGRGTLYGAKGCARCGATGTVPCETCKGAVTASAAGPKQQIVMKHSLWERFCMLLGVSAEANPSPQRTRKGAYPIVTQYLLALHPNSRPEVREWGEFRLQEQAWRMTATVEITGPEGVSTSRRLEFVVRDRVLRGIRIVG